MREANFEKNARDDVKALGGWMLKWVSPGRRGVPDNLVFWPKGVVHFVEFKKPDDDKDATEEQARVHKDLRKFGARVFTITTASQWQHYLSKGRFT